MQESEEGHHKNFRMYSLQRLEKRRHAVEGPVLNPQYSLRNENKPNRPDASLKDAMVIQGYYI